MLDQIGAHGIETMAWRQAFPSSPTPSVCRSRGFRAGLERRTKQITIYAETASKLTSQLVASK
jgi:hypothetical protein